MTFDDILEQALDMLRRRGRVSGRALKRQFTLDDNYLADLKAEILYTQSEVVEDGERGLVWTGELTEPSRNAQDETDSESRFQALLSLVRLFLQREKRVPYRTLKHVFSLDDALLGEIRADLRFRQLAIDEDGMGLVWMGDMQLAVTSDLPGPSEPAIAERAAIPTPPPLLTPTDVPTNEPTAFIQDSPTDVPSTEPVVVPEPVRSGLEAERRQLTVMFCDLVGSTDLSGRLDPEDLREVVRAYQDTAAKVIERYEGHIAQYLGDGLLIYFGFPAAHEDDAQRAVYTGLSIPEEMARLNARLEADYGVELSVRIGIHTGPVVVGEMGRGGRHENLALGGTPNIAARLEGLAQPGALVISAVTAQLVQQSFVLQELGAHALKGVAEPMRLGGS